MTTSGLRTGQTIGHFYIEEKLGEGGMGAVYLGQDLTLSRQVAIKFLNRRQFAQQGNERMRESIERRFIREAKSAAAINHPNLAQIYEANFDNDDWYIAMEYIDGASLFDQLNDGRKFSIDQIVDICRQTVSGLEFAWGKYKIIHRDIKPHNIMLTSENQVKIVDLGLAKPLESESEDFELPELTVVGTPVGTPQYMAPEQASGKKNIDYLADIFALGATLYELCSGQKAFNERTAPMIYMAQLQKKYRPIRELNNDLPEALIQLIDSMLEPKPEDRVSSYEDILKALNDCIYTTTKIVESEVGKSGTFCCPNCSMEFSVGSEYIGADIECPQCQSVFQVPEFAVVSSADSLAELQGAVKQAAATESIDAPISATFGEGEFMVLREEYGVDVTNVENLRRNHCWESGVVAEILKQQICSLPPTASFSQNDLTIQKGWKLDRNKYYTFIKDHFNEFFVLLKELYNLMAKDLNYVLVSDDLNLVFSFASKARNLIASFCEFHERILNEPVPLDRLFVDVQRVIGSRLPQSLVGILRSDKLPREDQHLEMHYLLAGWVPHCHECLREIVDQLEAAGTQKRDLVTYELRLSFVPPTLYHFYMITQYLNIGGSVFKPVKANLLKG